MDNKQIVLDFYEHVFNNWDISYVDAHMKDDYKQHSAGVKDGKEGFMEFITEFVKKEPHADVVKAIAEDDLVCMFFKCSFKDSTVAKVFDLYRLEDGKLAEHWDSVMRVDNIEAASGNGHF